MSLAKRLCDLERRLSRQIAEFAEKSRESSLK